MLARKPMGARGAEDAGGEPLDGSPRSAQVVTIPAVALALASALLAVDSIARLAEGSDPPGWRALVAAMALGTLLSVLAHGRAWSAVIGRAVGFAAIVASARVVLCVVRFTAGSSGSGMYGLLAVTVVLGGSFGVLLGADSAAPAPASPAVLEGSLWSAAVTLIVGGACSVWPLAHTHFAVLPVVSAGLGLWALAASLGLEQRRWAWLQQVRRGARAGWRIARGADSDRSAERAAPTFFARERVGDGPGEVLLRTVDAGGSPYRAGRAERVVARVPWCVGRLVRERRRRGAALAAAAAMVAVVAASSSEGWMLDRDLDVLQPGGPPLRMQAGCSAAGE